MGAGVRVAPGTPRGGGRGRHLPPPLPLPLAPAPTGGELVVVGPSLEEELEHIIDDSMGAPAAPGEQTLPSLPTPQMVGTIVASDAAQHTPNGLSQSGAASGSSGDQIPMRNEGSAGGGQIPMTRAGETAAQPSVGAVQEFNLALADAEARVRRLREENTRKSKFLEEEWCTAERRRAHSEQVIAMRNAMVGGQLADAHDRIQRLSSELVAREATVRAECEQLCTRNNVPPFTASRPRQMLCATTLLSVQIGPEVSSCLLTPREQSWIERSET